jgi:hypothetical protein
LRVSLRALTKRQTGLGVASNGGGLSERSDRQLGHNLQSSSRSSTAKAGKTATNIAAAVAALTSTVLMTLSFAPFDIPGTCSFIRRREKGSPRSVDKRRWRSRQCQNVRWAEPQRAIVERTGIP